MSFYQSCNIPRLFGEIRLSVEAIEASVKSIDLDDEAVNVFLRK